MSAPGRHNDENDDDAQLQPWEDPDEADMDDTDDPEVVACEYCNEEISEDAEVCPSCGNFLSIEDAAPPRKPVWIVSAVAALLLAALAWAVFGLRGCSTGN